MTREEKIYVGEVAVCTAYPTYQNEKNIAAKVSKFLLTSGIITRTLKPSQVKKHTRLKICDSSAVHALL